MKYSKTQYLQDKRLLDNAPPDAFAVTVRGHLEGKYPEGTYIDEKRRICGDYWVKTCSPTRLLMDIQALVALYEAISGEK